MTLLLEIGVVVCVLAAAAVGLTALGSQRWAGRMATLARGLEAARNDRTVQPLSSEHYDAHELEGLPAPVQRYFRAVLKDGQPIVSAVMIKMTGTINMSAAGERWQCFTSKQRVITRRPGFMWDAQISMLSGMKVRVVDSYIAGNGLLQAAMLGLFTVAPAFLTIPRGCLTATPLCTRGESGYSIRR